MSGIFTGIAHLTRCSEWKLDPEEASRLVSAWQETFAVFGVPELSEKGAALMELGAAHATIVVPRMAAIAIRKRREKPKVVIPFPGSSIPPANQQAASPGSNGTVKASDSTRDALNDILSARPTETIVQ